MMGSPGSHPHDAQASLTPCSPPPPQRKRKCLACIKLGSEGKVLGRMVHCPIETQVLRVRRGKGAEVGTGLGRWMEAEPMGQSPGRSLAKGEEEWGLESAMPGLDVLQGTCRWALPRMLAALHWHGLPLSRAVPAPPTLPERLWVLAGA